MKNKGDVAGRALMWIGLFVCAAIVVKNCWVIVENRDSAPSDVLRALLSTVVDALWYGGLLFGLGRIICLLGEKKSGE